MSVRTLFVVPSLIRSGAETQLVNLVNELDPTRFEKHLFTFEARVDQLERVHRDEVTHHQQPRRSKLDIEPARVLARLIDELRVDIVHCTLQIALLMGWLAVRLSRRHPALVVAVHTTINRTKKDEWLDRLLYRWLMATCARVLFVCDSQREHWIRKFPGLSGLSTTVHNGIELSRFDVTEAEAQGRLLRERLSIPQDASVLAHVAALRPEKGHKYLFDALSKLIAEGRQVVAVLAGDGYWRAEVERLVAMRSLAANVRFLGSVSDTRPVYGAADIVVLPSTSVETFSMAMLEALALEKPVVASDIGGTREAVQHGKTGLLVSPGDTADLTGALRTLLSDRNTRLGMGQAGRKLVSDRFTQTLMVAKTAAVLCEVGNLAAAHKPASR